MQADSVQVEIVQITDTHLFAGPEARLVGVNTRASARAVLGQALENSAPDLLMVTGDIAQEATVATYTAFLSLVREYFQGEIFTIPGNHDLGEPMREAGLTIGRASLGAWSVIGVDTHIDGEVGGKLTETEFERLEEEIAVADAPHVLLVGHHPPIAIGTPWLDTQRIVNGDRLLTWMRRRPQIKGYLFGHVHQRFERREENLHILGTPSTCFQFTPGSETFAVDRRPPGYRRLTLMSSGEIRTHVNRLATYDIEVAHADAHY